MSKKGVICRVETRAYYLLTPAGDFIRVRGNLPRGARLGDEMSVPSRLAPKLVALAAAAALVLMTFGNWLPTAEPDAEYMVALDVNPSFELAYKPDYIVTGVRAFDSIGEELLVEADLVGMELHLALAELVGLCTANDLGQGELAVTRAVGAPFDSDLLTGALEVRGLEARIHLVVAADYKSNSISPLRNLLQQHSASAIDWEQPGALTQALGRLDSAQILETQSWQESALVQYLVDKYSVGSALIGEMLAEMSPQDTAMILAAARGNNQSPRELWQRVLASGQAPGEYLTNQIQPDPDLEQVIEEGDALELLGRQYNVPAGRLLGLVRRGYPLADVAELLAIAKEAGMNLQNVINLYDRAGQCPEAVRAAIAQDPDNKKPNAKLPDESNLSEAGLAHAYAVNRGEISRFVAKGFNLSQIEALLYLADDLERSPDSISKIMDRAASWAEFVQEVNLDPDFDLERIAPLQQRMEDRLLPKDVDKPKPKD